MIYREMHQLETRILLKRAQDAIRELSRHVQKKYEQFDDQWDMGELSAQTDMALEVVGTIGLDVEDGRLPKDP